LPFKQLDAIVFAENAGLTQAMVVAQRETVPGHRVTAQNIDVSNVHG
jgi:hypothetical protein